MVKFDLQYRRPIATWARANQGLQSGETYDKIGVSIEITESDVTWEYDNVTGYGLENNLSNTHAKVMRDRFDVDFDFVRLSEIYNNGGALRLCASDEEYLQCLSEYPIDLGIIRDDCRDDLDTNEWIRGNFNGTN